MPADGEGWETFYNYRDLSETCPRLLPGRIARCANPALASPADTRRIIEDLGVRTLLDLRDRKEAQLTPGEQIFKAFEDVDLGALKALPPRGEGRVRYFIGGGMQAVSALAELQGQKAKFRKDEAERGSVYATKEMNMGIFMRALLVGMPESICASLRLCASRQNHPLVFYCTCGRDRTGLLAALVLAVCGASDAEILADYGRSRCLAESEAKYKVPFKFTKIQDEYFLKHGVGGGKRQPPAVLHKTMQIFLENIAAKDMTDTLDFMRARWGSVNGFLDHAGFDAAARAGLRAACCGSAAL